MSSYWSQYWQQGHLTSFGNDFSGNYTGALKKLWETFFTTLDVNAAVLDIGTGNGSIIALGNNINPKLVFTGLDSAKLTISEVLNNASNVSFIEQTSAEHMPLEDETYDYVVSQFGIEYSNLAKSLLEVSRVLKPGGQFQFVLHDSESTIVKPNRQILDSANALLESGVIDTLRRLFSALENHGQQSELTEQLRQKLNTDIAHIAKQHSTGLHGTNFPAFLQHVMNPKLNLERKEQDLSLFLKELEGQIVRLSDLVDAAIDDSKLTQLKAWLLENKLEIVQDESILENNNLIGRNISGIKSAN